MAETWCPIPGFEGLYEVSDAGRVRSLDRIVKRRHYGICRGRILQPKVDKGRVDVELSVSGRTSRMGVGRAVLLAFTGPCPDGMECCHNDGDMHNNSLSNLRWDTHSSNAIDCITHGTHPKASKTECPHGHQYDIFRNNRRDCRTCTNNRRRAARHAARISTQ